MPYCPKCDMEFIKGVTVCSDCGGPLFESKEEALAMQKAAINEFFYPEIDKFIVRESEYMQACSRTSDFEEAVTAFLEKRSPVFQGK